MNQTRFHIIFRTCDAIQALRGQRPFGLDKRTLIKECFLSLYDSVKTYKYSIHVLGDKLSAELMDWFENLIAKDSSISLSNGSYGNDESIRQSIRRAVERPDDEWVYLCEDDYLHSAHAFDWFVELIENRDRLMKYVPRRSFMKWFIGDLEKKPLIIHPADYPDRYEPNQKTLSFLFLTQFNHWRQIANTTFTVLAQAQTFRKYYRDMMKSAKGADDDYFSHFVLERLPYRGRALCVSPIPGVATHMHDGVMTPLVDWNAVHERYAADPRVKS